MDSETVSWGELEAENQRLQREVEELRAENASARSAEYDWRTELDEYKKVAERLFDLVRYCRATLHADGLITDEEFSELVIEGGVHKQDSVKRLHSYDALRARIAELEKKLEAVTNSAVNLLMTGFCEEHQLEVKGESFGQFYEKEQEAGCFRCATARVEELEARIAAALAAIENLMTETDGN